MSYSSPYIAILDIGHGNSTVLKNEEETAIVDCGSRGSGLLEFLEKEEIYTIDSVFLSHADQDHIGGLLALLASAKFKIRSIYLNSDSSKESTLWDGLVYELSQLREKGEIKFQVGITRDFGTMRWGALGLTVVGPTGYLAAKGAGSLDRQNRVINSNSISASFHVSWEDKIIVYLSGDIDQVGLDDLLDHKIELKAPLLVFPHHGGNNQGYDNVNFTKQLCGLTNSGTVIFSIGRNKHDNPRPEIIAAVRSVVKDVRVSCTQLSKNCSKELPKSNSPHLLDLFARGKEKIECCSGTFLIKLGENIEYFPELNSHLKFILKFTESPLCN